MPAGGLLNASVGAYRLVDFLGAGGMGEVYRAVHSSLGRVVAIKVLAAPGAAGRLDQRFQNEARIQSSIHHPNIVALYDFLEIGGRPCIVMECVDGETLDQRIRHGGPIPPAQALHLFRQIADAVGYLHAHGVVHRDLKGGNIKLGNDGRPKLLDFGLARTQASPRLTATGFIVGTLEYMAPEQLGERGADERSDRWALGVILYEMLTGRLPFESRDPVDLMRRIARAEYRPARSVNRSVPEAVDAIVESCLRADPADRVQSVAALMGLAAAAERRRDGSLAGLGSRRRRALRELAARPDVRRAGVVAFALIGLAFLLTVARDLVPGPRPALPPPRPAPPEVTIVPAGGAACGLVTGPVAGEVRTVTLDVANGPARVLCRGTFLGTTPRPLRVELGRPVRVTLERAGFERQVVEFTPTESTKAFLIALRRLGQPISAGSPDPRPLLPLLAAWLPFGFGRRRSAKPKPNRIDDEPSRSRPTNEGAAVLSPAARIQIAVLSDVGCVRESNEDAIACCRPDDAEVLERQGALLVVADGMGGHSGGEVASRLAVETVVEVYADRNADPQAALGRALRLANRRIREAAALDPGLSGMGTTCTALVVRQGWAHCAHVGDSRLYLVRDGSILQMTEDDSAVFDLVRKGVIDRELARHHPDRNVIVKALGSRADVEIAAWTRPLFVRHYDRFLASSDGLHDLVSDDELCQTVLGYGPEVAARILVGLARERGGHDNISVGILAIGGAPDAPTIPMASGLPTPEPA